MNLCMICGRVTSEVKYDFLYDYKDNVSIAYFRMDLNNKMEIDVYGFDEIADKIYAEIKKGNDIFIEGKIRTLRED